MKTYQQLLVAFTAMAAAQDLEDLEYLFEARNPMVAISPCTALSCTPDSGSICALEESPGPEVGVAMAAAAINVSSTTSFSLTLIDGLSQNGIPASGGAYETSDQQLFVGVDPNLDDDGYPSGCVLMMQYQGQTFPRRTTFFGDVAERPELVRNTTSCDGVLEAFCRSAIFNITQTFNRSNTETDRCQLLTEHVNMQLRALPGTCGSGGTWISNFINVTGGSLPGPESTPVRNERLGNDECQPVLPEAYRLYKVAEMIQWYFPDPPEPSEFYARQFGGRAGFTPVFTVIYGSDEDETDPEMQFFCMKTFEPDGEPRLDPLGDEGHASAQRSAKSSILIAILAMGLAFVMYK